MGIARVVSSFICSSRVPADVSHLSTEEIVLSTLPVTFFELVLCDVALVRALGRE